jgi:hypothetical protein
MRRQREDSAMADCANKQKNLKDCTCTYMACTRRGLCCECVAYHRGKGQIPGCFFSKAGEALYDRSVATFIKDQSK